MDFKNYKPEVYKVLQSTKYMYLIKSKMMDLDSTRAFKPFLTTLILKENITKSFDEELAENFQIAYGFKLPFFILTNIIYSYIADGFVENIHSFLYFNLEKMRNLPQVDNSDFEVFSIQYENFINKFIQYCHTEDFDKTKAEQVVMSFVKIYDTDLIIDKLEIKSIEEMDVERYLFYTFIKDIRDKDISAYNFLIKLCQGNLIKSYLFNEGISSKIEEKSMIFLDSPILYRILGYYGSYYQNEYEYLINLWLNQGYKLFVFDHNLEEMEFLLRKCMEMIEDVHFNYAKAPQITQTFKENGWDSVDIEKEISAFEEKLNILGIFRYTVDYNDLHDEYFEDQETIITRIKQIYSIKQPIIIDDTYNFAMNKMIEIDAKSIFCAYAIRENNKVKKFSDSRLFYVTNNSGMSQATYEYNKDKYPGTISPVIRDSLIGMMACSNDMGKIQEIVEKNIISLCYSTYRPTRKVLEIFTNQIESMRVENQITDEQYLTLKHNRTVLPSLIDLIEGNLSKIDYKTIHGLLLKVEQTYTEPIREEYEKRLSELEKEKNLNFTNGHQLKIELVENHAKLEEAELKVNEKEEQISNMERGLISLRDKKINAMKKHVSLIVNVIVLIASLAFIVFNIIVYVKEGYGPLSIILGIISLAVFTYNVTVILYKKLWNNNPLVTYIIEKRKIIIEKEYEDILNQTE